MAYYGFESRKHHRKRWRVISPDRLTNEIVDDLPKFCFENKLNAQRMRAVARGEQNDHLGWKCEKVEGGILK